MREKNKQKYNILDTRQQLAIKLLLVEQKKRKVDTRDTADHFRQMKKTKCKAQKEQGEGEMRIMELQTALSFRWGLQDDVALHKEQTNY